jgi:anti-sigma regulatory factor (Ser/Thr protein kinase)
MRTVLDSCEKGSTGGSTPDLVSLTFSTDLAAVRAVVERYGMAAGLTELRTVDLVIAVNEVAANTVKHARAPGRLDIWRDRDEIICEVADPGYIADPLAGARIPRAGATTGYGLWLVRRVCDRVELYSDETGTTVRMHMALPR